jgi:hypothetical protein
LRAETTPDAIVPVLVLDVDETEAAKILATLDPLSAMAEADAGKLNELLREVETGSEALGQMLEKLAAEVGAIPADEPELGPEPNLETKFAIIVNCDSEDEQRQLLEQFVSQGLECRALVV